MTSTIIRNITSLSETKNENEKSLVHIAIRSIIDLSRFNAKDYWWTPAFKQLGREIAIGEDKFLIRRIQEEVKLINEACDINKDDLSVLIQEIERLNKNDYVPNVILAPPSIFKSFVHFFNGEHGKISFQRTNQSNATIETMGIYELNLYLIGRGILRHLVLFNRANIIWKIVPNPSTGYALTVAVGKGLYPDKVGFVIGTTVNCVIKQKLGVTLIPIKY